MKLFYLMCVWVCLQACAFKPFELTNYKMDTINLKSKTMRLDFTMQNVNNYGATLRKGNFWVLYQNDTLGLATLQGKLRFKKHQTFTMPIEMRVNEASFAKYGHWFFSTKAVPITISGKFKGHKGIFPFTYRMHQTDSFSFGLL
jgi:hypothetical protein